MFNFEKTLKQIQTLIKSRMTQHHRNILHDCIRDAQNEITKIRRKANADPEGIVGLRLKTLADDMQDMLDSTLKNYERGW